VTYRRAHSRQQLVVEVIRTAARLEAEASGSGRRAAFRSSRYLLAGATAVGISTGVLADALGVKADTVRTRAGHDGPISAAEFAALSGIPIGRIHSWGLPPWGDDRQQHSATLLLMALLNEKEPAPHPDRPATGVPPSPWRAL
jgi:hypothetical protein